jgi:hypothetical protein
MGIGVPLGCWRPRAAAARRVLMRFNDLVFAFPALLIGDHDHGDVRARRDQRHHRHRHLQHAGLRAAGARAAR